MSPGKEVTKERQSEHEERINSSRNRQKCIWRRQKDASEWKITRAYLTWHIIEKRAKVTETERLKAVRLMDYDSGALLLWTISAGFRQSNVKHYKAFSLLPATELNTNWAAKQRQRLSKKNLLLNITNQTFETTGETMIIWKTLISKPKHPLIYPLSLSGSLMQQVKLSGPGHLTHSQLI